MPKVTPAPIPDDILPATLVKDGDTYTVSCAHATRVIVKTHDPTVPESEEMMIRYALQRHSSLCEKACALGLWDSWFSARRERFIAEGNANAHG